MTPEKSYRPNVGIIVFNRKGEVLVGERVGVPDSWQFPQGGIDEGEDPQAAALRELYEEVGINNAVLAYVHPYAKTALLMPTSSYSSRKAAA